MKKFYFITLIGVLLTGSYAKAQEEVNMLFIGNSFTARHNVDLLVKELLLEGNPNLNVYTKKEIYGGQSLFQHTELYNTQTFIEQSTIADSVIEQRIAAMQQLLDLPEPPEVWTHYFEQVKGRTPPELPVGNIGSAITRHENLLKNNPRIKWDYVVFQSWVDIYPDLNEAYAKYVKYLGNIAREQGAKVILYSTAPNYQNQASVDGPIKQEELEEEMDILLSLAQDFEPFAVVPVPQAINNIQQGGTDLTFRYESDFHPNQRTAFLTANMFYAAITKESSEGFNFNSVTENNSKDIDLGLDPDGDPLTKVFEEEEKIYLQQTAYSTVMDFEKRWKGTGEVQVRGVHISNEPVYPLMLGDDYPLEVTVYPTYAVKPELVWEVVAGSALTIDSTGLIKTLELGTAKVKVTTKDGAFSDSCVVEVVEKPYQAAYALSEGKIPGIIEAEYYDEGGQDVAYNDDDKKQGILTMRPDDNVDINKKDSASNGYVVGYTARGEWLEYTVDVESGFYDIVLHYGCGSDFAGILELILDYKKIATFSDLVNGGWDALNTLKLEQIKIDGGTDKVLRLSIPGNAGFFIDALEFIRVPEKIRVSGVSMSGCPDADLLVGENKQLTVAIIPDEASDKSVSWASSDEGVATVDENGLVTAIGAGEANITVTSTDGEFTELCKLIVVQPVVDVSGVGISNKPDNGVEKGETYQFEVLVTPEDATNKTVSWSSSDESIASINQEGLLTALEIGSAVITVTSEDGLFSDMAEIIVGDKTGIESLSDFKSDEIKLHIDINQRIVNLIFPKIDSDRMVSLTNISGQILFSDKADKLTKTITLDNVHISDIVFIQVVWPGNSKTFKIRKH